MKTDILSFFGRLVSPKRGERCGRRTFFAIPILASLVMACSPSEDKPAAVLTHEEMTKVLTDFYLKEARVNSLMVEPDSAKTIFKRFRKQYAEKSGISDSVIDISYQYYLSRPQELNDIYNRVIDSLSLAHHKVGGGASGEGFVK